MIPDDDSKPLDKQKTFSRLPCSAEWSAGAHHINQILAAADPSLAAKISTKGLKVEALFVLHVADEPGEGAAHHENRRNNVATDRDAAVHVNLMEGPGTPYVRFTSNGVTVQSTDAQVDITDGEFHWNVIGGARLWGHWDRALHVLGCAGQSPASVASHRYGIAAAELVLFLSHPVVPALQSQRTTLNGLSVTSAPIMNMLFSEPRRVRQQGKNPVLIMLLEANRRLLVQRRIWVQMELEEPRAHHAAPRATLLLSPAGVSSVVCDDDSSEAGAARTGGSNNPHTISLHAYPVSVPGDLVLLVKSPWTAGVVSLWEKKVRAVRPPTAGAARPTTATVSGGRGTRAAATSSGGGRGGRGRGGGGSGGMDGLGLGLGVSGGSGLGLGGGGDRAGVSPLEVGLGDVDTTFGGVAPVVAKGPGTLGIGGVGGGGGGDGGMVPLGPGSGHGASTSSAGPVMVTSQRETSLARRLSASEATLVERDRVITELRERLSSAEQRISERDGILSELRQRVHEANAKLEAAREIVPLLDARNEHLSESLRDAVNIGTALMTALGDVRSDLRTAHTDAREERRVGNERFDRVLEAAARERDVTAMRTTQAGLQSQAMAGSIAIALSGQTVPSAGMSISAAPALPHLANPGALDGTARAPSGGLGSIQHDGDGDRSAGGGGGQGSTAQEGKPLSTTTTDQTKAHDVSQSASNDASSALVPDPALVARLARLRAALGTPV